MHVVLLAISLLGVTRDTDTVAVRLDTRSGDSATVARLSATDTGFGRPSGPQRDAAQRDSTPLNLAPTLDNRSLLGAALAGAGPEMAADTDTTAMAADTAPPQRRPRAVEYSDAYYSRLHVHTLASYLTVPLFVAQYIAGQKLWNNPGYRGWAKDVHGPLALGIGALFTVNTVTGVLNLVESNKDPNGRTRRWIHGLTMIAADAGFVVVGAVTPKHHFDRTTTPPTPPPPPGSTSQGNLHRNLAIASMGLALGSYLMMLLWKD